MARRLSPEQIPTRVEEHGALLRVLARSLKEIHAALTDVSAKLGEQGTRLTSLEAEVKAKLSNLNTATSNGNTTRNWILIGLALKFIIDGAKGVDVEGLIKILSMLGGGGS